ncbi:MAG: DNA polymerase III subunit delta [bacterium]
MKPDTFKKEIQQGKIPPVCLLYGEEALLVQEMLDLIRKKVLGKGDPSMGYEVFYGADADASTVIQAVRTVPLFGGTKLVVVKEIDRMPDPQKERFLEYIKDPVQEACLVMTSVKPDMRKRFFAQLQKQWPAVQFYHPYDEEQTAKWIRSYLKQQGYRIDDKGVSLLLEAHGRELQVLQNELQKLMLYKGSPGEISFSDVNEVSGHSRGFNSFELADAICDKDLGEALKILSHLVEEGTHPLMILSALAAKFRKLWLGKELEREGRSDQEILRSLNVRYKEKRFLRQLQGFQEPEIAHHYLQLVAIDESIKSGGNRHQIWIETMIQRICKGPLSL